jgi:hypothetical protein
MLFRLQVTIMLELRCNTSFDCVTLLQINASSPWWNAWSYDMDLHNGTYPPGSSVWQSHLFYPMEVTVCDGRAHQAVVYASKVALLI